MSTYSLILAVGIDVGPHPGIVGLAYADQVLVEKRVAQVSANLLTRTLEAVIGDYAGIDTEIYVGVERFVIGQRGGAGTAGRITRDQVGAVHQWCAANKLHCVQRPAVEVKKWATDARLEKARLITATKGMTHARDGARHALFTAVADGNIPDPLSRKARNA